MKKRYDWIDLTKFIACILVVLGHLYMSLTAKGWISSTAFYYCWPIQTIYTFHVPLFFVCSGFLYQMQNKSNTPGAHWNSIKKKALALGVPYFTFSLITLLLKIVFASEVNNQATPILRTLFWEPVAPYWYLYILFLFFCIFPSFADAKKLRWAFFLTVAVKLMSIVVPVTLPSVVEQVMANAIWFVLGMMLTRCNYCSGRACQCGAWAMLGTGVVLSAFVYANPNSSSWIQFGIAVLFILPILYLVQGYQPRSESKIIGKTRAYFMPVYLIHTIAAAMVRSILLKLGIASLLPHIVAGLIASFVIPILLYEIAKKCWWLLFWIEPWKALEMRKKNECQKTA